MTDEEDPKKENDTPPTQTTNDPDPDITAPAVEYVINTYDPGKEEKRTILNEKKV